MRRVTCTVNGFFNDSIKQRLSDMGFTIISEKGMDVCLEINIDDKGEIAKKLNQVFHVFHRWNIEEKSNIKSAR